MKTPYFEFSKGIINENWQMMRALLSPCSLYYAMKANSAECVIDVLVDIGAAFDVASINEFEMLLLKNVRPQDIICSLPVKSVEMIQQLYTKQCRYFVFDCYEELVKLRKYAPNSKKILRIDVDELGGEYIPYGMPYDEFLSYKENDPAFLDDISGVTFFLLENTSFERLKTALHIVEKVISYINRDGLIVNIGGSYCTDFDEMENFFSSFEQFAYELIDKYRVNFYAEPGRSIVLSAGSIITKINLIRIRKDDVEVFIDAGQQTKITFTPSVIEILNRNSSYSENVITYHFYGPLSSHVELFSFSTPMIFKEEDIIKLNRMGAYSNCFASHWHGLPFAEIIMKE